MWLKTVCNAIKWTINRLPEGSKFKPTSTIVRLYPAAEPGTAVLHMTVFSLMNLHRTRRFEGIVPFWYPPNLETMRGLTFDGPFGMTDAMDEADIEQAKELAAVILATVELIS